MLEKIAVAAGLANVYLTVRQNIWCWPVGVVMVSLYIYIFFQAKLYSDAGLNVFFLVMQFYGWYEWTRGPVEHARSLRPVTRLSRRGGIVTIAGVLAGTVVLGTGMHQHTDAALPYPDAFTTMLSVFAQFLMTRKILENWTLDDRRRHLHRRVLDQIALLDRGTVRGVPGVVRAGLSRVEGLPPTYRSSSSPAIGRMNPVRRGGGITEPRPRTASQMI